MIRSLVLVALSGALALTACSPDKPTKPTNGTDTVKPDKPKPPAKKKLVLATNSEPDTLDPMFAEMAASTSIRFLGQRELTMHNDKWETVPDLAASIPTMENGSVKLIDAGEKNDDGTPKQKMEVTWNIRPDAKWDDGTPVTADDFIFGWEVMKDDSQEIIDRESAERVESMVAQGDDKKTLVVTYKQPYAFYDDFSLHGAYPSHLLRARYKKPDGTTNNMKKDKYGRQPASNGPFKFKEWLPGQYISYVKNPQYFAPPAIDEVTFRIIPNNVAMKSALIAGDIHGTIPSGGLSIPEIEELRSEHGDKFNYYSVPGLVWAHIDFNLDSPLLKDKRVRKAIAHAINRKQLIDELFYGKYTISHTYLPPRHWGYKKDVNTLDFNLEQAAKLLDEAGWKQSKEGEVRKKGKEKLSLSISAVAGIKDIEQLQQVIQSDLRKIGVDLKIDNKPAKVFFGELARYRKFPHLSFYSWVMSPSSWGNTLWQGDMIPSEENSWQGQNYPGWNNAEATELLRKIPTILDLKKRKEMLARVQEIWVDELPSVPMYFRPVVSVTSKKVEGFSPTGTLTPVTWNAAKWNLAAQ
jgi:peptide/nickel transport system substrate-binding protein